MAAGTLCPSWLSGAAAMSLKSGRDWSTPQVSVALLRSLWRTSVSLIGVTVSAAVVNTAGLIPQEGFLTVCPSSTCLQLPEGQVSFWVANSVFCCIAVIGNF